ncbi:hypothetical protein FZC66_17255 [Priestia megaterium]|nr:hypothetical protein FZC66_17255 [Priestia megaterium]
MKITISPSIKERCPSFKIGVIHYKNIEVSDSPQMLKGRLRLFQESIYFDLEHKSIISIKGLQEWRELFKLFGTDPSKYRPSIESLVRRIQKQTYLPSINSAVDLNNFFSLQYEVPIGIYDLAALHGQMEVTLGSEDHSYTALNGRSVSLRNKIIIQDNIGPFGSPYLDSNRAPVSMDTREAIQFIFLKPSLSIENSVKLTQSLSKMFIQIHSGEAHHQVID